MKKWIVIAYWLFVPRHFECEWYWDRNTNRLRIRPIEKVAP